MAELILGAVDSSLLDGDEDYVAADPPDDYSKMTDEDLVKRPNVEIMMRQLREIKERKERFGTEIERLKGEAKEREHDTTDMVNYLEQEVKRKDMANKKLAKQLKELMLKQVADKKAMKTHFEITLKRAEQVFLDKEGTLLEVNKALVQEVSDLSQFRQMRHELTKELSFTKETINQNEMRHLQQLKDLENKFYEARNRLEEEADKRIAHSRLVYKEEVGKELDMDSKRIRNENKMMEKELKFQVETSKRLVASTTAMKVEIQQLRQALSATKEKDGEFARKGLRQAKSIAELAEKRETLEKSLLLVAQEGQIDLEMQNKKHAQKVKGLQAEIRKLTVATASASRELSFIQETARMVLMQRNEVEKLFLTQLDTVKSAVARRREAHFQQQLQQYHRRRDELAKPARGIAYEDASALGPPPKQPPSTVHLKDLTQADREEVLASLVKGINSSASACRLMGPPFSNRIKEGEGGGGGGKAALRADSQRSLTTPNLDLFLSRPTTATADAMSFITDPNYNFEEQQQRLDSFCELDSFEQQQQRLDDRAAASGYNDSISQNSCACAPKPNTGTSKQNVLANKQTGV
eukprot:CAMPEP_0175175724 /NCGR_PEP_ID=MMETSP0087-20121206/33368_1 /TAXON_ID=136419 /ORGANISM="Unknown Unknown, Strain D1" /LENGTH=581 /DNA_ID=CAMNT_0016467379 /DNA_START=28 /DNA_END=1771 /DNA_ORIENTATION=+